MKAEKTVLPEPESKLWDMPEAPVGNGFVPLHLHQADQKGIITDIVADKCAHGLRMFETGKHLICNILQFQSFTKILRPGIFTFYLQILDLWYSLIADTLKMAKKSIMFPAGVKDLAQQP